MTRIEQAGPGIVAAPRPESLTEALEGLRVFMSYSRRDAGAAEQWVAALQVLGHEVFRDTTGIPYGTAWRDWIRAEIERADAVVFLVSEAWLESVNCREEFEVAAQDGKRLLPVAWGSSPEAMPETLAALNVVLADPALGVAPAAARIDEAARTDPAWLLIHRRLLQEAKDWQRGGRASGLLQRRAGLQALEHALAGRAQPAPALTALQLEYLGASRQAVESRRRWTWTLVTAAVSMVALAATVAALQWHQRAEQQAVASARRLLQAAEQAFQPTRSPHTAMRLALAARAERALPEVDDFLRQALSQVPAVARALPNLPGDATLDGRWMTSAITAAPDGSVTWTVFHDGRRGLRVMQVQRGDSEAASEIEHRLPAGWVGAVAAYGGLLAFQPEPSVPPGERAHVGPGHGDEVQVLALPALAPKGRFSLPGRGPTLTALDAQGRFLALARDGRAEIWQIEPRQRLATWALPTDERGRAIGLSQMQLAATGRWLALVPNRWNAGRAPLWLVDLPARRSYELATFPDLPRALAFNRSGTYLAAADRSASLRIFRFDETHGRFAEIRRIALEADGAGVDALALSPDGTQVAAGVRNGEVFDVRTGRRTAYVDARGPFLFSGDALDLWGGDDTSATVRGRHGVLARWRLPTASEYHRGRTTLALWPGDGFAAFDFMPEGEDLVAVGRRDEGAVVLDGATGTVRVRWPLPEAAGYSQAAVAVDAGGGAAVTLASPAGGLRVDGSQMTVLPPVATVAGRARPPHPRTVIAADGQRLLLFSQRIERPGETGITWLASLELSTGRIESEFEVPGLDLGPTLPTVGGTWLVLPVRVLDGDQTCTRFEVRDMRALDQVLATLPCTGRGDAFEYVAHAGHGGKQLFLASEREVRILALPGLQPQAAFERAQESFEQFVDVLTSSPDGRWLAWLDRSNGVTVTDARGNVQARLRIARDGISSGSSLRFSADGKRLGAEVGTSHGLGSLYVWRWQPDELVPQVCARLGATRAAVDFEPALRGVKADPCAPSAKRTDVG